MHIMIYFCLPYKLFRIGSFSGILGDLEHFNDVHMS